MEGGREKILSLQHLLQEKFGSNQAPSTFSSAQEFPTAVSDVSFPPNISPGSVCEIVAASASSGVALSIERLLLKPKQKGHFALIDGRDCFDPQDLPADVLNRILWLRCSSVKDAVKSADWLLRDGNLSLVMMDLQMNPVQEARRIRSSAWYRLRALAKETDTSLFVFSQEKLIPCAHSRWILNETFSIRALDRHCEKTVVNSVLEKMQGEKAQRYKEEEGIRQRA